MRFSIMIADFHIHTCFSGDSEANVDAVIQSAISKGMKHMAITALGRITAGKKARTMRQPSR